MYKVQDERVQGLRHYGRHCISCNYHIFYLQNLTIPIVQHCPVAIENTWVNCLLLETKKTMISIVEHFHILRELHFPNKQQCRCSCFVCRFFMKQCLFADWRWKGFTANSTLFKWNECKFYYQQPFQPTRYTNEAPNYHYQEIITLFGQNRMK